MFFRHSSVYPFPESSKKRANFHTHQVNSNWAVPQTIESSAKICGSLEILHSHIPPQNSSRFFLLHTWHGTLSGVRQAGKPPLQRAAVYKPWVVWAACSERALRCCHRGSRMSVKTPASRFYSVRTVLFLYIVFIPVFASPKALANLSTVWQMFLTSPPKTDLCFRFYTDAFLSFSSATRGDSSMWDWAFDIEITLTNWLVYEAPRNFPGCNFALPENTVQVNNHFC